MEQLDFKTFDDTIIKGYLFQPKQEAKGIVQIVHGLEEHGMRYENFAKFLNENGFIVFASDQRLHGKTAGDHLSSTRFKNVFPRMVKDQMLISDMLIEKFSLPLIIFGHSCGSFITQMYIQNYHKHSGTILSGSAYMKRADTLAGEWLSKIVATFNGGEKDSKVLEDLVLNSFNRKFNKGESWISQNKDNVERYNADPLCGKPLCSNFYYSMFKNTRKLYTPEGLNNIDKDKLIFIASGKDDPVGKMGESTKKLYETYLSHNINAKLKLYDNLRHEIINEEKQEVLDDILSALNEIIENSSQKVIEFEE